jgi:preprotein translocase subunit SecA
MHAIPGSTWRMLDGYAPASDLPRGLDAAWDFCAGCVSRAVPRRIALRKTAEQIVALERQFANIADSRLREQASLLHETFRRNRDRPEDLARAFAVVREVAFRRIGERPFLVQVMGALALNNGTVAEMATGEGKTLTATMAVTVAGWRGKGCHVVTVNDYLARRDAEWMGKIYRFCGLRVGFVQQGMPPEERRLAYDADVTYCTNKEVAADFLRDRLMLGRTKGLTSALLDKISSGRPGPADRLIQRGLYFAVIDEADSIMIDEAVTPLIISGNAPNPEQTDTFKQASIIARELARDEDYTVNDYYREIELTDTGKHRIARLSVGLGHYWVGARRSNETIIQALTAREFYQRQKNYIVDDDKIVIVDDFTGRLMPDRTWRDGLHQAIEAKEDITVNPPKATYARISFQRFFRLYRKLSGMTGTAKEAASEFWQIYHLPVVVIPTNKPCVRKVIPRIVLPDEQTKWRFVVDEIISIHKTERPVLVGTRSIRATEQLSALLREHNLDHQVLNAVHHKEEAEIVARAGRPAHITVATNMAGRGTDIKLGRGVADLGGLHVISAESNESARIDRQLFGRGARQGDPGSAQAIVSLDDEVVVRHASSLARYLHKRHGENRQPLTSRLARFLFRFAHFRAERMALNQRKSVLKTDHWLNEQLGFAGTE